MSDAAVAERRCPGGVVVVGTSSMDVATMAFGRLAYDATSSTVQPGTIYDLASLTKVVVTTTLAMMLSERGALDVDAPASRWLPQLRGRGKEGIRVSHLLRHTAGLPAWVPFYADVSGKDAVLRSVLQTELVAIPGDKEIYSDLGFMLLGDILAKVGAAPLEVLTRRWILEPLGMSATRFGPIAGPDGVAPTEHEEWRGRLLRGEVHDPNAYAMGGVAPHAGLFGTAPDLARFARALLCDERGDRRLVSRDTLRRFTVPAAGGRALGWETPSTVTHIGSRWSPRSYGHTGLTGTFLWIDPERDLFLVLLTNSIYPKRRPGVFGELRAAIADAVVEAMERS